MEFYHVFTHSVHACCSVDQSNNNKYQHWHNLLVQKRVLRGSIEVVTNAICFTNNGAPVNVQKWGISRNGLMYGGGFESMYSKLILAFWEMRRTNAVTAVADVKINEINGKCLLFWHLLIRFVFCTCAKPTTVYQANGGAFFKMLLHFAENWKCGTKQAIWSCHCAQHNERCC